MDIQEQGPSLLTSILIRSSDSKTLDNEWDVVELQGTLEPAHSGEELKGLQGLELGHIQFDEQGTPLLTIGSNLLEGKIYPLAKPYLVIEKQTEEDTRLTAQQNIYYKAKGVIRRKIIFKTRPKPLRQNQLRKKPKM